MKARFQDHLAEFTPAEIISALGCPSSTAYQWKDGKRQPPEWQQPHWLAILRASKNASQTKTRKTRQ